MIRLRATIFAAVIAGVLAVAVPAAAQQQPPSAGGGPICVQLDSDRDTLTPEEQKAAWSLMVQAFEQNGIQVDASGTSCADVYTVYNVRLGESITATVYGPLGRRDMNATKIEDLPNVYSQMVRGLLGGQPLTNDSDAVTRHNVTRDQVVPRRVTAESLKYVKLGYGGVGARDGLTPGPGFGFGYRYELDQIAIDGSINLLIGSDGEDDNFGASGSFIKLMALHFFDPIASSSMFGGLGVSWGASAIDVDGQTFSGAGLQAEVTVAYEMLRASTIRLFAGVDLTLPLYLSDGDFGAAGERYTPTVLFSVGGGIGKVRNVRVIHD